MAAGGVARCLSPLSGRRAPSWPPCRRRSPLEHLLPISFLEKGVGGESKEGRAIGKGSECEGLSDLAEVLRSSEQSHGRARLWQTELPLARRLAQGGGRAPPRSQPCLSTAVARLGPAGKRLDGKKTRVRTMAVAMTMAMVTAPFKIVLSQAGFWKRLGPSATPQSRHGQYPHFADEETEVT